MGAVQSEIRAFPSSAGKCTAFLHDQQTVFCQREKQGAAACQAAGRAAAKILQASGRNRSGTQAVCPRPEKLHGFHCCAARAGSFSGNGGGEHMYQPTCCPWKSKTYPACFYKAGCRESWFWDCKRAGYRAKIRRAALYRAERGPFYRDTYHRKILSGQGQWNCRKITKTVPWTGYTDIQ